MWYCIWSTRPWDKLYIYVYFVLSFSFEIQDDAMVGLFLFSSCPLATAVRVSMCVIWSCSWRWKSPLSWPSLSPRGQTLFRRTQTPRLMDDRSDHFPGFSSTREIVIQPLREDKCRPGPGYGSALIFLRIQDAMKRLKSSAATDEIPGEVE